MTRTFALRVAMGVPAALLIQYLVRDRVNLQPDVGVKREARGLEELWRYVGYVEDTQE